MLYQNDTAVYFQMKDKSLASCLHQVRYFFHLFFLFPCIARAREANRTGLVLRS